MFNNFLTKKLLKWIPNNEQSVYEKRLISVMKNLKVQHYDFNWDRTSCFVEFHYNENSYRLEHSIEKAKESGIILHSGLDCLRELTQSLEDLQSIIARGMNDFETWISGMKQSPSETNLPEFQDKSEVRNQTSARESFVESNTEEMKELIPFRTETSLNLNKVRLTNNH